jgi:hypothetical protein
VTSSPLGRHADRGDDRLGLGEQGRIDNQAGGGGVVVELGRTARPTMAEATLGSRSTQASANWVIEQPASAARGFSCWTAVKIKGCR